jgi:ABC-2 type transport system ATP-binding protein
LSWQADQNGVTVKKAASMERPDISLATNGAESSRSLVTVDGLTKRYGDFLAVDGASFELATGTVTAFLGPNGAGKTTTLRLLLGLAKATGGSVLIMGRRYREIEQSMHVVGALLESGDFDLGRSGRNHLRILALAADVGLGRVDEVLELVGLRDTAKRPVKTYSLGMRQRLALAAALLGEPRLLVLDEPGNGLDPGGMHWLRSFLRQFAAGGGAVLVASHDLAEVAQLADRILIIDHGRIVADEPLDRIEQRGLTLEEFFLSVTKDGAS